MMTLTPQMAQRMREVMRKMSVEQQQALKNYVTNAENEMDMRHIVDWVARPDIWKQPLVSFDTFIDSKMYLGVGDVVYPEIRRIARTIIEGKHTEAVIVAGIGSGKTTVAELIECYMAHKLLCMRDPYKYYRLAKDKPIALINMGPTATQALEVGFKGVKNFMDNSPWFRSFNPHMLEGSIRFRGSNILLISGNSKATTPLGYNVYYGFLDEAAFYMDNENKSVAEDIYSSIQRRIVSRFGHDGLVVTISSPNYEGDFIMKKLVEAEYNPDTVFGIQLPTWKCKPEAKADMAGKFYFDARKERIFDVAPIDLSLINLVKEPTFSYTKEIWEIPGEYRKSFVQNPQKAKRDFAALPAKTISAFMPQTEVVEAMFDKTPSPVLPTGKYSFQERPLRTEYFIHIDLAKNKNGKGDFGGFGMAHLEGWRENPTTKEKEPLVIVDLAERLKAGDKGEIEFEDVRQKIYTLKAMGFNIKLVTFDQFQSVDSQQMLRRKGIRSELLSVDRTVDPYDTYKALVYDGRVKCHTCPELKDELTRLELREGKVDHPPNGTKDVADATCGAVFNVMSHGLKGSMGMANTKVGVRVPNASRSEEDKTAYYQRLEELRKKGII